MALRLSFIGEGVASRSGGRTNKVTVIYLEDCRRLSQCTSRGWHMTGVGRGHQLQLFAKVKIRKGGMALLRPTIPGMEAEKNTSICGIIIIF